ncbi:MAG: NAD(P)H-hydrate dehydratase [Janthinobacterium lividum]
MASRRLNMPPVLDAAGTRAAEAAAIAAGTPALVLMERAGAAAATAILRFGAPAQLVVACGTGNNGGDGYVVARHLAAAGVAVTVAAADPPATGDARTMAARWTGPTVALAAATPAAGLVDAVFGIGLSRAVGDDLREPLARLAAAAHVRIALDLPSGLSGDDGADLGVAVRADLTVAFGTRKPAHLLDPGRSWCGRVVVAGIGLDASAARLWATARPPSLEPGDDSQKYSRGAVLVLGGPAGHGGAARLASRAALRVGAGLVMLAVPAGALAENAGRLDAVMVCEAADPGALAAAFRRQRFAAIAAGPGFGSDPAGLPRLWGALDEALPVVLDADVFTLFAGAPDRLAAGLRGPAVLTPHAGEFARLFGDLPGDRIARVRAAAARIGAVVLLKGAATVIAAPDGRAAINVHATPWLATAGSGDVLTGIVAGLLAQGFDPFEAACAGAWLHGDAGRRCGPGLIAEDLPDMLPAVLRGL